MKSHSAALEEAASVLLLPCRSFLLPGVTQELSRERTAWANAFLTGEISHHPLCTESYHQFYNELVYSSEKQKAVELFLRISANPPLGFCKVKLI